MKRFRTRLLLLICLIIPAGCGWHGEGNLLHLNQQGTATAQLKNPMYVPLSDREFLWNQLIDTVDDHFRIEREERVRLVGGVLTEGRVETFPCIGSTMLEPWRTDSTKGFERLYATLHSIRRRARVRVMPQTDGGYLVEVAVYKELEDVSRPEYSTVDTGVLRHDGSLRRPKRGDKFAGVRTLGWIALGRDTLLEQRILTELRGRLGVIADS